DHKPLVTFKSQIELLERQSRWQQIIYQFDCEIKDIDGQKNYIPDALSRIWHNPKSLSSNNTTIPQQVDPLPKPQHQTSVFTASTYLIPSYKDYQTARKMSAISHPVTPLRDNVY